MINEIIQYFGGQRELANVLQISEAAISIWKRQGVPPGRAIEIEIKSNGVFKAVEIIRDANI